VEYVRRKEACTEVLNDVQKEVGRGKDDGTMSTGATEKESCRELHVRNVKCFKD
jgi:hypothetical protein